MTVNHWLNAVKFNDEGLIPAIAQDQETGKILMMAWMNSEALNLTVDTKTAVYYSRSRHKLWHKGETSGHTQMVHDIFLDCDGDAIVLLITQVGGISCHTGRHSCFYRQLNFEQNTPNWQTVEPVLKDPKKIYQHAIQIPSSNTEANTDTNDTDINEHNTTPKTTTNPIDGADVLSQLDIVLRNRKHSDADSSYVASLYAKGINKILEKVGEEAVEAVIAAKDLAGYALTKQPNGNDNVVKPQALVNDLIYEIADVWFHTMVTLAWFDIPSASILEELSRRFGLCGLDEKASR